MSIKESCVESSKRFASVIFVLMMYCLSVSFVSFLNRVDR
ncbi:MAG: hypothetical protein ACFWTU_06765 [Leuconostoc mesenteroides]